MPGCGQNFFFQKHLILPQTGIDRLKNAQKHNDSAKVVIEEQKLSAADAIIAAYKEINKEENPLLAKSSHFAPQNKEENPLLAKSSHFAPQNKED